MEHFHGRHWRHYIEKRVRPRFEQFGQIALSRIMPAFEGINEEATALEHRRYGELVSSLDVRDEDVWDAGEAMAELAFNEAAEYAEMLSAMQFSTLNLFSAALYHMTEQHLIDLCLRILNREDRHNLRPRLVIDWFKDAVGLDVATLRSWPLIEELRLVANVVKHGEGDSAQALRKLRPELFVFPTLRDTERGIGTLRIETVLFGQDFYVTVEDFAKYHEGSVAFWAELANGLPGLTR